MIKNYLKFSIFIFFLSFCLTKSVNAQLIVSIAQDSAYQGQTLNVVITGNSTNFGQGTSTTQVWLSQGSTIIPSNSVFVVNTTQMIVNFTFPISAPVGYYNVNAYDDLDYFMILTNGFLLKSVVTGIAEVNESESSGKAYPNPFSDALKLEYSLKEESAVQITLYDISGRIMSTSSSSKFPSGDYVYEFDSDAIEVPAGIYFIRLRINDTDQNYKVVKK